jgi:hypothetical protein
LNRILANVFLKGRIVCVTEATSLTLKEALPNDFNESKFKKQINNSTDLFLEVYECPIFEAILLFCHSPPLFFSTHRKGFSPAYMS